MVYLNEDKLRECQEYARSKEGQFLSTEYKDSKTKLKWRCKEGHRWESDYEHVVRRRHWCVECHGTKKATIEDMQRLAESKGGKCLSTVYVNKETKLWWQCKLGHIWDAKPNHVKRVSWCPTCSQGVSERVCREYFKRIFGKEFPKVKPDWLRNEKGNKIELDGYCKELKLAFERQGEQHYTKHKFFNVRTLEQQKNIDELKRKLCKQNGIILIEIPYTVKYGDMLDYIAKECMLKNVKSFPNETDWIDYKTFDVSSPKHLEEMQKIAESKGGRCLSEKYIDAKTKLKFQCKEMHQPWFASPEHIRGGKWCPVCARNVKHNIPEMQKIAESRDGMCLSTFYVNEKTHLKWQCNKDDCIWNATPSNIIKSRWCPECGRKRRNEKNRSTIEEMQELAKKKEGKCLSTIYIDAHTPLRWQCRLDHEWNAVPNSIQQGRWCPVCANKQRWKTRIKNKG